MNNMEINDRELRKLEKQRLSAIRKWDIDLINQLETRIAELKTANNTMLDDIISGLKLKDEKELQASRN